MDLQTTAFQVDNISLRRSWIPALSGNEVPVVATPDDVVFTTSVVRVGDGGRAISPEGVVVSAAGAGAAWRSGAWDERLVVTGRGSGIDCSESGASGQERAERDHDEDSWVCWLS